MEALKDLKQELLQQKEVGVVLGVAIMGQWCVFGQNLHEELIEELHRHLYVKAVFHKPGMPCK